MPTPILIVEDERLVAETMGCWLRPCGYDVTYAACAADAMEQMSALRADVALIDVGLPGAHDGLWLIDQFRQEYPAMALILATGRDALPESAIRQEGVVSFLLKPFGRDQLRDAVAIGVRWHQDVAGGEAALGAVERAARALHLSAQDRLASAQIEAEHEAVAALRAECADPAEMERNLRVAALASAVAHRLPLKDWEREAVYWAGRFSSLCRATVPEGLSEKAGPLSHAERAVVARGPLDACDLLRDQPFLTGAAWLLHSMRERVDGTGHPDGLSGAAIPLGSRILAVAEAVDAMMHDRPYRPARTPAEAVAELRRCAGTQFDPDVVEAAVPLIV